MFHEIASKDEGGGELLCPPGRMKRGIVSGAFTSLHHPLIRAVVRVSNTRTSCQLVTWAKGGDVVVLNVTGNDLVKKFSWPEAMSKKSIPASYLVGFALGKAAIAAGHEDAVLDIGLAASTPGSPPPAADPSRC